MLTWIPQGRKLAGARCRDGVCRRVVLRLARAPFASEPAGGLSGGRSGHRPPRAGSRARSGEYSLPRRSRRCAAYVRARGATFLAAVIGSARGSARDRTAAGRCRHFHRLNDRTYVGSVDPRGAGIGICAGAEQLGVAGAVIDGHRWHADGLWPHRAGHLRGAGLAVGGDDQHAALFARVLLAGNITD